MLTKLSLFTLALIFQQMICFSKNIPSQCTRIFRRTADSTFRLFDNQDCLRLDQKLQQHDKALRIRKLAKCYEYIKQHNLDVDLTSYRKQVT
jgi:hypothetical protein